MNEPRRIELSTNGFSAPAKKKKVETPVRTQRFTLTLTEPTAESCPEFSYLDLCKGVAEEEPDIDPDDPFAAKDRAEHDALVKIAQKFEAKYAAKPGKRKRKDRVEDLVDIGDGYDESDSFVDNTEAYDEYIPCTLSTKFGGFYINTGQLDLIPAAEDSYDEMPIRKKHKKNRLHDSDPDDSQDKSERHKSERNGNSNKKRSNDINETGSVERKRKRKMMGQQKLKEKAITVASLLTAAENAVVDVDIKSPSAQVAVDAVLNTSGVNANNSVFEKVVESAYTVTGSSAAVSTPGCMVKLTSVDRLTAADAWNGNAKPNSVANSSAANASSATVAVMSNKAENLTESLPVELLEAISKLECIAKQSEDGSIRQFTPELTQILLVVENQSRQLSSTTRSSIFASIGRWFACGKEGLIKRVKKLSLTRHDDKLKRPIADLNEALQRTMPALLEKYQDDLSVIEKLRQGRLTDSKEHKDSKETGGDDDSEEDDENNEGGEKVKRLCNPRKKFEWTDELRKCLCRIVAIKMEHFEMSKIRREAPEDYIRGFLDKEIKPLWPRGWIQTRMLFKESRSAHAKWTSGSSKRQVVTQGKVGPAMAPAPPVPAIDGTVNGKSIYVDSSASLPVMITLNSSLMQSRPSDLSVNNLAQAMITSQSAVELNNSATRVMARVSDIKGNLTPGGESDIYDALKGNHLEVELQQQYSDSSAVVVRKALGHSSESMLSSAQRVAAFEQPMQRKMTDRECADSKSLSVNNSASIARNEMLQQTATNELLRSQRNDLLHSPPNELLQSPRSEQLQSPRSELLQSPRNEQLQSPRNEQFQSPRKELQQSPRNEMYHAPKSPGATYYKSSMDKSIPTEMSHDKLLSASAAINQQLYAASMAAQWAECLSNIPPELTSLSPEQLLRLAAGGREINQFDQGRRGSLSHSSGRDGAKHSRAHRRADSTSSVMPNSSQIMSSLAAQFAPDRYLSAVTSTLPSNIGIGKNSSQAYPTMQTSYSKTAAGMNSGDSRLRCDSGSMGGTNRHDSNKHDSVPLSLEKGLHSDPSMNRVNASAFTAGSYSKSDSQKKNMNTVTNNMQYDAVKLPVSLKANLGDCVSATSRPSPASSNVSYTTQGSVAASSGAACLLPQFPACSITSTTLPASGMQQDAKKHGHKSQRSSESNVRNFAASEKQLVGDGPCVRAEPYRDVAQYSQQVDAEELVQKEMAAAEARRLQLKKYGQNPQQQQHAPPLAGYKDARTVGSTATTASHASGDALRHAQYRAMSNTARQDADWNRASTSLPPEALSHSQGVAGARQGVVNWPAGMSGPVYSGLVGGCEQMTPGSSRTSVTPPSSSYHHSGTYGQPSHVAQ